MEKIISTAAAMLLSTSTFSIKVMGEKVVTLESLDDYAICMNQSSGSRPLAP